MNIAPLSSARRESLDRRAALEDVLRAPDACKVAATSDGRGVMRGSPMNHGLRRLRREGGGAAKEEAVRMMDVHTTLKQFGVGGFGAASGNRAARRAQPVKVGTDVCKPKDAEAKRKARRKMQAESRRRNRGK